MKKFICAALFALVAFTTHAQVVYTSRTVYDTAHPNNFVIDFNNYGPAGTFYSSINAPTPGGPVNFDNIPSIYDVEILSSTSFGIAGAGNFVLRSQGTFLADSLLITLPANTFSFGTDIISPSQTVPEPYKFTIFSGSTVIGTLTPVSAYGGYTFTGFDSLTSPITSVAVQIANGVGAPDPILDNFTVVPEPSTWLAAGLSLLVIAYSQRRRLARVLLESKTRQLIQMFESEMKKLIYATLFALVTATTHAQVVYTDRTVYDTAHPNNFVVDFNNATPGPFQYPDFTAPSPGGNITFDAIPSANNIEFVGNNVFPFLGANNLVLYAFNGQFLTDSLLVSLPTNTFSFGLDVISPSGTVPEPYKFTIFSGSTVLATLASPSVNNAYTFFGFDSASSPITSVALQIANGIGSPAPVIDNFTVVPEPSTWFGAGLCLLFVVYSYLRKRSRVTLS